MSAPLAAPAPPRTCPHIPPCPPADAPDHDAAHVMFHDPAGFSVLCNHVVVYDDTGETLPDRTAVAPHRPEPRHCANPDHTHCCDKES